MLCMGLLHETSGHVAGLLLSQKPAAEASSGCLATDSQGHGTVVLTVACSAPSEMLAVPQIKSRQTRKQVTLQFLVVK